MRYFSFLTFVVLFCVFSMPVQAGLHVGYCDQAESTADTLACVKAHTETVQSDLNAEYTKISTTNGDIRDVLEESQNHWIAYRDSHCAIESGLTDQPALERIYELSCVAEVTEQRLKLLKQMQIREKRETPREFSTKPRWMNVLAHDHPDVFWRYGKATQADLNCDDSKENIMTGVKVADGDSDKKGSVELVIAVADNPVTGRPNKAIFNVPLGGELLPEDGVGVCAVDLNFAITSRPLSEKELESENETCSIALQISDRKCAPLVLYNNGSEYDLVPLSVLRQPENKTEVTE